MREIALIPTADDLTVQGFELSIVTYLRLFVGFFRGGANGADKRRER